MKQSLLITDASGNGSLHCPVCGGYNLHHETVAVYTGRCPVEDLSVEQEILVHTNGTVDDGYTSRTGGSTGPRNPSLRRSGIRIRMSCEDCSCDPANPEDVVPDLIIYQHKGTTYIEWDHNALIVGAPKPSFIHKDGL